MSLEGQRLGEFEILERLGQGGMGAVYKARQASLRRTVALKTLQAALAADAEYIARFENEAVAAASLNHPNLVQVYSAGENGGLHWFAMEYVEGESAQGRLKRKGRIEPVEAIAIAMHVATALDYGWRKAQLIHRDIKPDNIFLSGDGEVKLGDLGLAKSAGQTQGLTMTGASMGTPHYISPEQTEGKKDTDLRTDIYSLGCTLYHMLCGQPPYKGDSAVAVMMKHVSAPVPDLRGVWPECPAELASAVMKMMQKQPAARQQSYEEVNADLRRAYDVLTGASAPSASAAGEKKRGVPVAAWAGVGVALLAAIAALVYSAAWKKGAPAVHGGAAPSASEPGAIRLWDSPEKIVPTAKLRWEETSLRSDGETLKAKVSIRDVVLRASVRLNHDVASPQLKVRIRGGSSGASYYSASISRDLQFLALGVTNNGKDKLLQKWPLPRLPGPDQWIRLELRAIGDDLTFFADGKVLGVIHDTSVPDAGDVGIVADAKGYFRDIEYEPLDKPGAATPEPAATKLWDAPEKIPHLSYARWENAAVRVDGQSLVEEIPYRDLILRATVSLNPNTVPAILVRTHNLAKGQLENSFYSLKVANNVKSLVLCATIAGQTKDLQIWPISRPTGPDQWLRLELRIVGDELTAFADGKVLGTVHDSSIPDAGFAGILANAAGYFRDIEYVPLDKPAPVVSPSPNPQVSASAAPATATKDKPFVNTLGMKFVPVPMVSGPTARQRVLFGVWDVRVQDYDIFAKEQHRESKPDFPQGPTHPQVMVSWNDAQAFCVWLTERERKGGRLAATERYRLPTDHEWSCAVGIGEKESPAESPKEKGGKLLSVFPWGNTWPPPKGAGNYSGEEVLGHEVKKDQKSLSGYRDDFPATAPVGSFPANRYGLYDMSGNAWQWCEDLLSGTGSSDRVLRGGSWDNENGNQLRMSYRFHGAADSRDPINGFRCVLGESAP